MSDEIAQVVEQDVAQPMLKAVEDIGETVPTHFTEIGERLEGAATAHLENESGIVSSIEGVSPSAVESETAGTVESEAGAVSRSSATASEPLSEGSEVADAQVPGGQGASEDPIDLVSGEMFLPQRDLALPGVLALVLERTHRSGYRRGRWFGRSWASTLDQRVEVDEDGIHYAAPDGVVLHYPVPQQPGQKVMPAEGARWPLSWDRAADTIRVEQPERGLALHFPPGPTPEVCRPLSALSDRNGNRITFVLDDEGVPTGAYHSGGYHVLIDRDYTPAGPRITGLSLADPRGGPSTVIRRFGYDAAGRLSELIDSSGLPQIYEYDDQDRMTSWTDRNAYRYEYHYDQDGRVVQAEGTGGYLAATFAYDLDARTTTLTDSLGHATVHHFNERGQVYKVVDPLGGATLTEQDRYNRLLSRTDALGHTTRYVLDDSGDPSRIDRPDGTSTLVEYNALRRPTAVTGPDAAVWRYTYDERGNLASLRDPSDAVTTLEYDERGAIAASTDALGHVTRYESDACGLPVSVTDARGMRITIERDAFGRISTLTDAAGSVCRMGWTVEGRPAWRAVADGDREEWSYDAEGNLLEHRGAAGAVTRFEYGPFDQPTSRTDPSGARHTFAYDSELRLIAVTNSQDLVWRYDYDAVDNLISEVDFNDRTLSYRYDAVGALTERVNGAGQTTSFARDELGRMTERRSGDAVDSFVRDPVGRLVRAEGRYARLEYTRDVLGRVLTEAVDGRALAHEYDACGQRVRRTTPTGAVSEWAYDPTGLPSSLVAAGGSLTFEHDAVGRETTRFLGAGAAISQGFDASGRLVEQAVWAYDEQAADDGPAAHLTQRRAYTYRPDGLPLEIDDQLRGITRYDLDVSGRVTLVRAATWTETYAYDALGNLAQSTGPGGDDSRGERESTGTRVRRAGRTTYDYDDQGRLVRSVRRTLSGQVKQWTYVWDADDRLTELTTPDGAVWRYIYDPLGRRTAKQRLSETGSVVEETWFAWDGGRLAEQVTTNPDGRAGAITWDWDPDSHRPVAQTERGWAVEAEQAEIDTAFYAIVTDLVGTPTELVSGDGRVAWYTTTDLWGGVITAPASETECLLRFPGQYRDEESGLNYNVLRYYDPATGTYASADPLGLNPAPNNYAYARNPLAWFDPFGLAAYQIGTKQLTDKQLERPSFRYQKHATGSDTEEIWRVDGARTEVDGNSAGYITEAKWTGRNDAAFSSSPYNPDHEFYNADKITNQTQRLLNLAHQNGSSGVRYMVSSEAGRQAFSDLFTTNFKNEMDSGFLKVYHVPGNGM